MLLLVIDSLICLWLPTRLLRRAPLQITGHCFRSVVNMQKSHTLVVKFEIGFLTSFRCRTTNAGQLPRWRALPRIHSFENKMPHTTRFTVTEYPIISWADMHKRRLTIVHTIVFFFVSRPDASWQLVRMHKVSQTCSQQSFAGMFQKDLDREIIRTT